MDTKSMVNVVCSKFNSDRGRLIDILLDIQSTARHISEEAIEEVASALGIHRVEVEGVVTFYSFFSQTPKGRVAIRLCDDIIDRHAGAEAVGQVFSEALGIGYGQTSTDGRFSLDKTACIGMSDQAPAALINNEVAPSLTPDTARRIALRLVQGMPPESLFEDFGDGNNSHPLIRSAVNNNIRLIGDILLAGDIESGKGLERAFALTPERVVEEISGSGLRGRGGAGFPTGKKLALARAFPAQRRFVICNADEGEPGTFKDRVLLTERAELLFDGMTIAAYAIGASEGILYLRAEYSYLRGYLEEILARRRASGLLGGEIHGSKGFGFDIRIQMGAGAYICGEESALISSCEGLRGEPKNRPPFPVEKGYLGYPTVVNNVETLCNISRIMERGGAWFASYGTGQSAGTKLLSVSGDCGKPGVYEAPFGLRVRELLEMVEADNPAIVQVGGPSGAMIGKVDFDRRICFEDLPTGGAVMVFGARRNALKIVDAFLEFFIDESCGYCTPCRVGNVFLQERIQKIMNGFGETGDMDYLESLSRTITATSRCGLGATSSRPVTSSIQQFPLVYASLTKEPKDGLHAGFDIQRGLEISRKIARRQSMIYDRRYGEEDGQA
ncbi:MAG: NAD(P)H-dependent oxidoreductase subunit E [Nitrospinota bacterium]|nr:NAD(P)H-dependent oxidoreductase subunit E [Nitrospinota bacterium]